jgi:DNA-binding response OmpR family regulator
MMPKKDGFSLAEDVKKLIKIHRSFPYCKKYERRYLKGYQLGADDYITKPFDTELLLYKIKAILQRSSTLENEEQEQFKISNIFFDSMLRQLRVGDKEYKLSPKENELLKASLHPQKRFHAERPCVEKDLEKRKLFYGKKYGRLYCQAS